MSQKPHENMTLTELRNYIRANGLNKGISLSMTKAKTQAALKKAGHWTKNKMPKTKTAGRKKKQATGGDVDKEISNLMKTSAKLEKAKNKSYKK